MSSTIGSLTRSVSPPRKRRRKSKDSDRITADEEAERPTLAAVEAGQARIYDHLEYFVKHLCAAAQPMESFVPHLSIDDFKHLYQRNSHERGKHFVVHQHNHPVAGVHYDLRLQFSKTSACSWAIPYGLPGNPNSRRKGRMAIETRVHNLWNNLIESASHATGSLLIWDTGEYEVLPRRLASVATEDEASDASTGHPLEVGNLEPENEKLIRAFQGRYIRLRLHGRRLPRNYTITVRLPSANDRTKAQPKRPAFRRRRHNPDPVTRGQSINAESTDSGSDMDVASPISFSPSGTRRRTNTHSSSDMINGQEAALASDGEDANEAETIHANNAYTGASNTIGSIHQRNWFLSLDKRSSGFTHQGSTWVPKGDGGFEPFYVMGADVERSLLTGRTSSEVMADEGVEGFQGRKMWRPVMD